MEECVLNLGKFHNVVRLVAFCPFSSSQVALENANAVSEGELAPRRHVIRCFCSKRDGVLDAKTYKLKILTSQSAVLHSCATVC